VGEVEPSSSDGRGELAWFGRRVRRRKASFMSFQKPGCHSMWTIIFVARAPQSRGAGQRESRGTGSGRFIRDHEEGAIEDFYERSCWFRIVGGSDGWALFCVEVGD